VSYGRWWWWSKEENESGPIWLVTKQTKRYSAKQTLLIEIQGGDAPLPAKFIKFRILELRKVLDELGS
jgi:hypothetical protein